MANLPSVVKPDTAREATSKCSGRVPRGDTGRRASKDQHGNLRDPAWRSGIRINDGRETITACRPSRESEGAIVARKRGNSRGAKGPCRTHGPEEGRRTAWGNPITESHLLPELSSSSAAKLGHQCMPRSERVRASRMREIFMSGLKRAEAAGYTAPPLLDYVVSLREITLLSAPSGLPCGGWDFPRPFPRRCSHGYQGQVERTEIAAPF